MKIMLRLTTLCGLTVTVFHAALFLFKEMISQQMKCGKVPTLMEFTGLTRFPIILKQASWQNGEMAFWRLINNVTYVSITCMVGTMCSRKLYMLLMNFWYMVLVPTKSWYTSPGMKEWNRNTITSTDPGEKQLLPIHHNLKLFLYRGRRSKGRDASIGSHNKVSTE